MAVYTSLEEARQVGHIAPFAVTLRGSTILAGLSPGSGLLINPDGVGFHVDGAAYLAAVDQPVGVCPDTRLQDDDEGHQRLRADPTDVAQSYLQLSGAPLFHVDLTAEAPGGFLGARRSRPVDADIRLGVRISPCLQQ